MLENLLYLEDGGLLPEGFADSILPGYCASLSAPGYRAIWTASLADFHSERLRNFIEKCYVHIGCRFFAIVGNEWSVSGPVDIKKCVDCRLINHSGRTP